MKLITHISILEENGKKEIYDFQRIDNGILYFFHHEGANWVSENQGIKTSISHDSQGNQLIPASKIMTEKEILTISEMLHTHYKLAMIMVSELYKKAQGR